LFLKQSISSLLSASSLHRRTPSKNTPMPQEGKEWWYYGGNPSVTRYSPLDQINRFNVHKLRVAWTYVSGDPVERARTTIECTALVVRGVVYLTTPLLKLSALEASTGRLVWKFDPFEGSDPEKPHGVNRGVTYWESANDKRIFFVADARL